MVFTKFRCTFTSYRTVEQVTIFIIINHTGKIRKQGLLLRITAYKNTATLRSRGIIEYCAARAEVIIGIDVGQKVVVAGAYPFIEFILIGIPGYRVDVMIVKIFIKRQWGLQNVICGIIYAARGLSIQPAGLHPS